MKNKKSPILIWTLFFFVAFTVANQNHEAYQGNIKFVENKGQWENFIQYKADIPDGNLFLLKNKLTYVFYKGGSEHLHGQKEHSKAENKFKAHAFHVNFLKANDNITIKREQPYEGINNYYLGNDPAKWQSGVISYQKIIYENIWPNIDWQMYSYGADLKYDFVVHPGTNTKKIKLLYEGVDNIYLSDGNLHVHTSVNNFIEQQPYAYQIVNGIKITVPCDYKLKNNELSFSFPEGYNRNVDLVIDPRLIFSSYSGSTANNFGFTASYDDEGNLYAGGNVFGMGYPTSTGAYDSTFNGGTNLVDISISKFSTDGSSLIYSTYLGGNETEVPHSLVTNSNNELYILGTTSSTDFPISSDAADNTFGGGTFANYTQNGAVYRLGTDIIVCKLNADGTALLGSTYMGGSGNDGLNQAFIYNYGDQFRGEIIVDDNSNIFVASSTRSVGMTLVNPLQDTIRGSQDGFVFKLNSDLSVIEWSTYFGGNNDDAAYGIQFDRMGNMYICGGTTSDTLLPGISATSLNNQLQGNIDGFIGHISADGSTAINSTYLGTTAYDQVYFVQTDTNNNVYVLGQTEGQYDSMSVNGSIYYDENAKQFIHKLNPTLNNTIFATTFGTNTPVPNISPSAFLVNDCENIFLSGWGGNTNNQGNTLGMFVTANAYDETTDGSDFYFLLLSQNAASALYATFFGGTQTFGSGISAEHVDGGTSRFDKKGIMYQAVCASCGLSTNNFPTTPGVVSNTDNSSGGCNIGVIKFDFSELTADLEVSLDQSCGSGRASFANKSLGGIKHHWIFGDGTDTTLNSTETVFHNYDAVGTYEILLIITDSTTCTLQDTASTIITIFEENNNAQAFPDTTICLGESVIINALGGNTFYWSPSISLSDSTISSPIASPDSTTTYQVIAVDSNGCIDSARVTVNVKATAIALFDYVSPIKPVVAVGDKVTFINQSSFANSYSWTFGDGTSSTEESPSHAYSNEGIYTVCLTAKTVLSCDSVFCLDIEAVKGRLHVPTAFSPNGDGENDHYFLKGKGVTNIEFKIFNRWGELVYQSTDPDELFDPLKGWDGKYKGELQEMEVYVYHYKVSFIDGESETGKGDITLVH